MDAVCEECGDVGLIKLLLHCSNCMTASRHRYCFPTVIFEPIVRWMCSDCLPKHSEANKSLEDMSNQRLPGDTQVGSYINNGLWSWGSRSNRSNPSMVKDHLVCNEGSQDETNRGPPKPLLSTEEKKIQRGMDSEAYHVQDDPSESGKSWRVNETSSLKSAEGDQNGRNLKCNVENTLFSGGKKLPRRHVLPVKSINNESLSSKYVSPCESTKVNPRKQHNQSDSQAPHEAKYQKAELIKKNENAYDAHSKSGRPEKNGSNYTVIDTSELERYKKRYKSWSLRSSCAKRVTKVDQMESSRQSDHTNSGALIKVSSKTEVHAADVVEPKKRRRFVLSYDEVEDAEVMQVKDLDPQSCDKNEQLKKQKRSLKNRVKNKKRYVEKSKEILPMVNLNRRSSKNHKQLKEQRNIEADDDKNGYVKKQCRYMEIGAKNQSRRVKKSEKASRLGNSSRRSFKNHKQVEKRRGIEANQNQNAVVEYLDAGCGKNYASVLPLQTVVMEEHCALSKMLLISEDISVYPIDKPYWTGIMKIGRDYIPLAAHLSNKAGRKVQELSRALPPIMKVMELSTLHALTKRLEAPKPIVDSVLLYFFSGDTRTNKELDRLVKHVANSGVVLETVVGLAKLFLFPSTVLPEEYQTYQGKHYLWGVFEHRDDKRRKLAPAKQDYMAHITEEEQVQEQHVFGQQDKAQHVTLDQEMPLVEHAESQPLLDTNRDIGEEALSGNGTPSADMKALVSTNISPTDCGQARSNSEAQPLEMCGFVILRTPRSVQLIQEMQKEGAIVFAVQQTLAEHVSTV